MELFEGHIVVGNPVRIGGLSVFPLKGTRKTAPPYLTGPEAFELGLIEVSELEPPEVPSLAIINLADVPILLVEGEMLVGGDQNRTMNVTVLVPPNETTIVPVSCVEAGRWGSRRTMSGSTSHAPGSLRAAKTAYLEPRSVDGSDRRSNQHRVWEEVELQSSAHDVQSETSALADVQEHMATVVRNQLDELTSEPDQVGVLCATGERVIGLDLFDSPATLERYLRRIVSGHFLDAELKGQSLSLQAIERFVVDVDAAQRDMGSGVGLGEEIRLTDDVVGIGLAYEKCLVHLAAYPNPD